MQRLYRVSHAGKADDIPGMRLFMVLRKHQLVELKSMFISDYFLSFCARYAIAITTAKSAAIVPITSNPGDFDGGVVGWSVASPGKVRLFISCMFVQPSLSESMFSIAAKLRPDEE